jgi:AraC-like DNA-binding protein
VRAIDDTERVSVRGVDCLGGVQVLHIERSARLRRLVLETYAFVDVYEGDLAFRYRGVENEHARGIVMLEPGELASVVRLHSPTRSSRTLLVHADAIAELARERGAPNARSLKIADTVGDMILRDRVRRATEAIASDEEQIEESVIAVVDHALEHYGEKKAEVRAQHAPRWVSRALDYLHAHMTEKINLTDLAKAAGGVSRFHLVRAFRENLRITPYEYLVTLRVAHASTLLSRRATCAEAASASGFFDQSHLHRHFTRILGLTPGAWSRGAE